MNILINRSDAIGDTVLTLPLAEVIKKKYPDAKIILLVSPLCRELLISNPFIDGIIVFDKKKSKFSNFRYLWDQFVSFSIDHYLYVGGSHFPSFMAWWMGVKFRSGLLSKLPSFFFLNKGVRQKRSRALCHEAVYNLQLLKFLDIEVPNKVREELQAPLFIREEEVRKSFIFLSTALTKNNIELKDEYIIIHPGMTGHTLNWPSLNYLELVKQIEGCFPHRFTYIFSYTRSDLVYIDPIQKEILKGTMNDITNRIFLLDGGLIGLRKYMGILTKASFFIGPSTGTTHMANALGVKTCSVYSPIRVQSANRWRPFFGHNAKVMSPRTQCKENISCKFEKCAKYECMSKVTVDVVCKHIVKMLKKKIDCRPKDLGRVR